MNQSSTVTANRPQLLTQTRIDTPRELSFFSFQMFPFYHQKLHRFPPDKPTLTEHTPFPVTSLYLYNLQFQLKAPCRQFIRLVFISHPVQPIPSSSIIAIFAFLAWLPLSPSTYLPCLQVALIYNFPVAALMHAIVQSTHSCPRISSPLHYQEIVNSNNRVHVMTQIFCVNTLQNQFNPYVPI